MTNTDIAGIRSRSAVFCRMLAALTAMLWVLLVLERFGATGLRVVQHGADPASVRALAAHAIAAIPDMVYLLALGGVRRALSEFARGELYAPTVARMLDRVGVLLAAGAFIGMFLVPGLQRALGEGPGYWIGFDVSALVLGALGLSLTVIARVFGQAAALKAELDEIF
jgi:dipeptide/tripeptide permease